MEMPNEGKYGGILLKNVEPLKLIMTLGVYYYKEGGVGAGNNLK